MAFGFKVQRATRLPSAPCAFAQGSLTPCRHGEKFDLKDSETWREPTHDHHYLTETYGSVRVRAWSGLHPKT